jgi:hypothetical protein
MDFQKISRMKVRLILAAAIALTSTPYAFCQGVPLAVEFPQYFKNLNSGQPLPPSAYVCVFQAGTQNEAPIFADINLKTARHNPLRLDADGIPLAEGGNSGVYLSPEVTYKFVLYPGSQSRPCKVKQSARSIWQRDHVEPRKAKVANCSSYAGSDAGTRIAACIADLPPDGGIADAEGITELQALSIDPFQGIKKPVVLVLGAGTYTTVPLQLPSNFTLIFARSTIIRAAKGYTVNQRLLNIVGVSDVAIYGNGGRVEMPKEEYTSGEQRHAVEVASSKRVTIEDLISANSGGDGFYIGAAESTYSIGSEDILLEGVTADNNRRQGLSIVSCQRCQVLNSVFKNTSGTSPAHGVDIEPNKPADHLENIFLHHIHCENNKGGGLLIVPNFLAGSPSNPVSILIDGYTSDRDGDAGTYGYGGLTLTGNDPPITTYNQAGQIVIKHVIIQEPYAFGVLVQRWASTLPYTMLEDIKVVNPNRSGNGTAKLGWTSAENSIAAHSAFVVASLSNLPTAKTGRIDIVNCLAIDNRTVPVMLEGFYIHAGSERIIPDIHLRGSKTIKVHPLGTKDQLQKP